MKSQHLLRIAAVSAFSLLFGLASPVEMANGATNITKTFVVRGSDDALVNGAIVRLGYVDPETSKTTYSASATTNSSGEASITIADELKSLFYVVFPPVGNVTLSPTANEYKISNTISESIRVKLSAANMVVQVDAPNGDSVGASDLAIFTFPNSASNENAATATTVLRSGPFGIALPNNLDTSKNYQLRALQFTDTWVPGRFSWRYGLKASGASGSQSYTVYSDLNYNTTVSPSSSGVYRLGYKSGNIQGQLKNFDGSNFTMPAGVSGGIRIVPDFTPFTATDVSNEFFNSTNSPNGNWNALLLGPAGRYTYTFTFNGSTNVPSFSGFIWKNSAGGFATLEAGPYTTSSPHQITLRLPAAPNFRLTVVEPGTSNAIRAGYQLFFRGTNNFISGGNTLNGQTAAAIPNGSYDLKIYPFDQNYSESTYKLDVVSGVVTVKTSADATVNASSGIYLLSPQSPNLKIQAVNAASLSSVVEYADYCVYTGTTAEGNPVGCRSTGTTFGGIYLPNGTYSARVWPGSSWATYKESSILAITVSGGVATITGLTADSNGLFKVPLTAKNFRYKIVQSAAPNAAVPNSWIDYVKIAGLNDLTQDNSNRGGEGVDDSGFGGAVMTTGHWLVSVNLGASSTDSKRNYKLQVDADGTVTLRTLDNSIVTATDGVYVISGQPANITGSLKTASNADVVFASGQGINLTVQKWNSEKNYWEWTINNSWRTSASFGFSLSDLGKYRVQASPYGFGDLSQSYSSEFEIRSDSGTKKWYQSGAFGSAITTPLTLNVTMAAPNFKIKLMDPRDNSLMKYGWISIIKKESNGNQFWVSNMDISSSNPGLSGASLSDGEYRLEVNPQNGPNLIAGLARKNYDLTVSSSGTNFALSYNGSAITAGDGGRYTLTPASSNVTGRVVSSTDVPLAQGNNQWVNINVQKFISAENRWDWTQNWSNIDNQGFFSISVAEIGKYRLRIEPNGFSDSTVTFSEEFEITTGNLATFNKAFGNIRMSAPALRARVTLQGSSSAISHIGIEVRKNGQWLDWAGTGPLGIASFSFKDTGTYELVAHPTPTQMNLGATKKTYTAVVTKNSSGVFSATITGLTPDGNGIYSLALGTGNLSGFVCKPGTDCSSNESNSLANAQIVAIDTATNRELWEYSANSSSTGKWSMNLPAGTYKIMARTPWGSSTYGNSDAISTVTVNNDGTASLSGDAASGRTTTSFIIALKNPTWSGTVRTPIGVTDAVVPYSTVCLYTMQIWNCANANAAGEWAMSAPTGFTAFTTDSILEIRDDRSRTYPMLRFSNDQNANAVSDALGGVSANNLVHRFRGSNLTVQVTATNPAGTSNVPYVWVSLDRVGYGWLGGGQTNAQGVASFNIDTATVTTGELNIRVEVGGNKEYSANFAPTSKTVSVATAIAGMNPAYAVTVALDTPNLKGILREPGAAGATTPWSWIELFDDATNEWKGGSSTDDSGQFSMNIPKPTSGTASYTLRVNPPWNSPSLTSSRSYTVTVSSSNQVAVTVKGTGAVVTTEPVGNSNYYSFTLASPSVTGSVVNASDTGIRDSWVVPISATTGEYYWQQGVNSKNNGSIAMALADGSYKLEANVPWNLSGVAKSAQCAVTIASGSITTATGGCVQAGGTVKLALRSPNVNLTLKYSGSPVANANVGLSIGAWYTNAQSKSDGKVSLFIDRAAVLAANPTLSGSDVRINVWVDPPYGNSSIVRWDCRSQDAKPLCQSLPNFNTASEYPTTNIGDVNFQGPNTRVKVVKSDNTALQNAWVSLFAFEPGNPNYGVRWIGGGNTDSSGFAAFNVDTSSATMRYRVEVNPPWNGKSTYSQKLYGDDANGLTWTQVNEQSFAIGTPNAKVIVKSPTGAISSWGWIGVEEVDSSNNFVKWVSGVGTDNAGVAAITLSSSKRYRLSANPGGGREGTRTECIVTTSSDSSTALTRVSCDAGTLGANNELTITLNNGNVNGILLYGTTPIANAIVVATSTAGDVVPTTSSESGRFGLQLDPSKTWSIKVFPVNSPTGLQIADKTISTVTFTGGSANLGNVDMVLKA
jgi:hypothetical protein